MPTYPVTFGYVMGVGVVCAFDEKHRSMAGKKNVTSFLLFTILGALSGLAVFIAVLSLK